MTEKIIKLKAPDGAELHARLWLAPDAIACLVLTHGVVSHSQWLQSVAEDLSQRRIQVLAVDRRGAGLNVDQRGDAASSEILLADLDAWVNKAQSYELPIHLGGFCWGANYAVNYLNQSTQAIQSLSLLAPSLFPSELVLEQPFFVSSNEEPTEPPTVPIDKFTSGPLYEQFILPDPLRVKALSPRMNGIMQEFSQGIWMKFLRIQSPVLVVLGTQDEVVNNQATETLFSRVKHPDSKLHWVDGQHGIQFDSPKETSAHLANWVINNTHSADGRNQEP